MSRPYEGQNADEYSKRFPFKAPGRVISLASHARRTLAFYRLDNERQYDALLDYQLYRMKGDKKNKK